LYRWDGEELAETEISPGGWEYIDLYPLGNDRTVVLNAVGDEGYIRRLYIFERDGRVLKEVFSEEPAGLWDYSEDGSTMFIGIGGRGRIILDEECREVGGFRYEPNRGNYWAGVSPRGRYVGEVTSGKYVVLHDRSGRLIAEHHVQGRGNYYAAFSPDEKYLCVTPGPWRVYFFETETGEMLWEYVDTLSRYRFVAPSRGGEYVFVSSTLFHPTNLTLQEMADKFLLVFNKEGQLLNKTFVSSVKNPAEIEFYRWKAVAPPIKITHDGKYLLVRLPSKLHLYKIISNGVKQ